MTLTNETEQQERYRLIGTFGSPEFGGWAQCALCRRRLPRNYVHVCADGQHRKIGWYPHEEGDSGEGRECDA